MHKLFNDRRGRPRRSALLCPIIAVSILVSLNLLGCSNSLLEEARGSQAKAAAPRIGVFKADGAALASEGSLDFGELSVGKSSSLVLTLKNSGVNDLVVAGAGASVAPGSGTAAGVFSLDSFAGFSIKAGESGSLKLVFSPTAAASYSATLAIASNDIAQPLFKLSLSGKGSATAKALTSFGIQSPAVAGVIDEAAKTILVGLPNTGLNLSALVATFESTGVKVLVGSAEQTSGVTVNDFANPLTYIVVAQDGSKSSYLASAKVLPSVSTPTVVASSASAASGSASIVNAGSSAVTESGICWSTSQYPTIADSHAASGVSSGSFTNLAISGLSGGTVYYARAYATSLAGTGYSEQTSFLSYPSKLTGLSAVSVGYDAGKDKLSVSWPAVVGAASYDVYASTSSTPPAAGTSATSGGSDVSGTSCMLSGLTKYLTYYVWARATNARGDGEWSEATKRMVGVPLTSISLSLSSYSFLPGERKAIVVSFDPVDATEQGVTWSTSNGNASLAIMNSFTEYVTAGSTTSSATVTATPMYTAGGAIAKTLSVSVEAYSSGNTGPGGGKLFYNGGSYATDGFKYMEAYAPAAVTDYLRGIRWTPEKYYPAAIATQTGMGQGLANTQNLVALAGSGDYGAYKCSTFSQNGYSDWFLPSEDEVDALRVVFTGINTNSYGIWSSSMIDSTSAWLYYLGAWHSCYAYAANVNYLYIPVRRF